ncbi:unnamed protein product [Adineta steineri]|uniref:UAS domain-containing protein n=1 Tax=Adineta steineri TaxID=433720 RepID=A0A818YK07_9BILA|nr:unnamed protein product [Adineta steineri]
MGNICPWCCKDSDDSQANNNYGDGGTARNSQRSLASSEVNDRTPLLGQSGSHNSYNLPVSSVPFNNTPINTEPLSFLTTVDPLPPPPILNDNHTDSRTAKLPSNETAESSMATIVERMLPDLIDVGGWGATTHQSNTNIQQLNAQNDHLKQLLSKSLQSTRTSILPDAGASNLSSLLSNRPISADICHFVAHTASELSRLLIDEIKIVHKEDLSTSNIEKDDSTHTSDRSTVTTDDEFFDELMDVPPEFEDCLIPDKCQNEITALEHLTKCLNRRFNAYPVVCMGTLENAVKEAFGSTDINKRCPLLIYVNNDKSIYTNLFCKQLLCNDKIIEYLMSNYVLWAWDVTYESNGQKLNEMCKTIFAPWTTDKRFDTNALDNYPLLLAINRDTDGNYVFNRLIEGSDKKLSTTEFLDCLTEFKDKFISNEQQLEKAKEDAKQRRLFDLLCSRDIHRQAKHSKGRDFLRSMSMLPHMGHDNISSRRAAQFTRLLSGDVNMHQNPDEFFSGNFPNREDIINAFEQFQMVAEDADDEEDDDRTPTVERPSVKFP